MAYLILIDLGSALCNNGVFGTCFCCCLDAQPCLTLVTPWTVTRQAPLSMGFPRQDFWSRLPFPSLEDFLDPGIKPGFPAWLGRFFTTEPPGKPWNMLGIEIV